MAGELHWSAPIYLLDLDGHVSAKSVASVIGSEFVHASNKVHIEAALLTLRDRLPDTGTKRLGQDRYDRFTSELSRRLDTRASALAQWIIKPPRWRRRPLPVAGEFFAPGPIIDA